MECTVRLEDIDYMRAKAKDIVPAKVIQLAEKLLIEAETTDIMLCGRSKRTKSAAAIYLANRVKGDKPIGQVELAELFDTTEVSIRALYKKFQTIYSAKHPNFNQPKKKQ